MLLALLLLSLFTLVLLGFYVFVAAPRSRTHQTFAAFIACLALWTINDIVMWGFGGGPRLAGWWASASFALSLLLQFAFVVFAWVFPENGEVPLRRSEEHTSELQSRQYLHPFPTRRSSDLAAARTRPSRPSSPASRSGRSTTS